jgi:hypothetical protein
MPLVAIPVVSSADAATNGKTHVKKHAKKLQQAPIVNNTRSSNPRYPSTYEDPDRKAGGYWSLQARAGTGTVASKSVPTDAGEAADGGGARCRRIVAEAGAGTGKK